MKLSVLLAVVLRHITVVSSLMIILDAVTCRVEVKLEFRGVPVTLIREIVSGSRFKICGGVSIAMYEVIWVMSGLRHSRELDPNTRQVNVTWSPGHVNCPALLEVSSTLSTMRKMTEWSSCTSVSCYMEVEHVTTSLIARCSQHSETINLDLWYDTPWLYISTLHKWYCKMHNLK